MRHGFHKILSLLLAAVIFYNVSGHFLFFLVQQQVIKSLVAELIHNNEAPLVLISLSQEEADVYLVDDSGEINYQNELYDIAFKEQAGGKVKLFCYKDVNEKNLVHHLGSHSKNADGTGQKNKNSKSANSILSDVIFSEKDNLFFEKDRLLKHMLAFLMTGQCNPDCVAQPPEKG
jgi:hypothetical protein